MKMIIEIEEGKKIATSNCSYIDEGYFLDFILVMYNVMHVIFIIKNIVRDFC